MPSPTAEPEQPPTNAWTSDGTSQAVDRHPPPEAVSLTEDGQLHLLTLREGGGETPPLHSRCLVHYVGRLAETGEVFMDTRSESQAEEPEAVVAGRDTTYREVGLNLGVAAMRRGELARLWAGPKYGYGQQGSFSFPTVPPNADLVYDLELLDWEAPEERGDPRGMLFEERLEAAERRRADGNTAFKEGRFAEATSKYRLALSFLNEDLLVQLDDMHLEQAQAVRRPALLNIAACQLRQEDYHGAAATCGEVLIEDPQNPKALYRRGCARRALGQTAAALADLEAARAAAPGDGGIVRELAAARRAAKEDQQAAGQLFKGFFEKSAEQLYDDKPAPSGAAAAAAAAAGPSQQQQQDGSWLWPLLAAAVALAAVLLAPPLLKALRR